MSARGSDLLKLSKKNDEFVPLESSRKTNFKKPKEYTSVRVSKEMQNTLNAMVKIEGEETVDAMILKLTQYYVDKKYTAEEKTKFEVLLDILKKN